MTIRRLLQATADGIPLPARFHSPSAAVAQATAARRQSRRRAWLITAAALVLTTGLAPAPVGRALAEGLEHALRLIWQGQVGDTAMTMSVRKQDLPAQFLSQPDVQRAASITEVADKVGFMPAQLAARADQLSKIEYVIDESPDGLRSYREVRLLYAWDFSGWSVTTFTTLEKQGDTWQRKALPEFNWIFQSYGEPTEIVEQEIVPGVEGVCFTTVSGRTCEWEQQGLHIFVSGLKDGNIEALAREVAAQPPAPAAPTESRP